MKYFVTGHTGFKGSWLIGLLKTLGHQTSGYSLAPEAGSVFETASMDRYLDHHFVSDVRNAKELSTSIETASPDVVIHMAAQALVRRSYLEPLDTFSTNVVGTLNVLDALSNTRFEGPVIIITTDKVYKDLGRISYVETDPLGGHDPYSASKAMADILSQSWAETNQHMKVHVARAGNVIGPHDKSTDRLLPDIVRSIQTGMPIKLRHPNSVRPWQHVLDCLGGYLQFVDAIQKNSKELPIALNFGPPAESFRSVSDLVELARLDNPELKVEVQEHSESQAKETSVLRLNSDLARDTLGWTDKIDLEWAVRRSVLDSFREPSQVIEEHLELFLR